MTKKEQTEYMGLLLLTKAESESLRDLVLSVAKALAVDEIDGLSPKDWFEKRRRFRLDELLMSLEDSNPELAALIQSGVNKARKPKQ